MKNYVAFGLIRILGACQSDENGHAKKYEFEMFSPSELKADLNTLYNRLDSVHFDLYHLHTKEEFQTVVDSLDAAIFDSMDVPGDSTVLRAASKMGLRIPSLSASARELFDRFNPSPNDSSKRLVALSVEKEAILRSTASVSSG